MKKIEYDKLYVAFPVFDAEYETEMYEQYETMGTIEHNVIFIQILIANGGLSCHKKKKLLKHFLSDL